MAMPLLPMLFATVLFDAVLFAAVALGADGQSLFDGQSLGRWTVVDHFDFGKHGQVEVKDHTILLGEGHPGTAIRWSGTFPENNYEITLEAMRVAGDDFFCGMTFPLDKKLLSLIVGGWGGRVVGLSCIDGEPAVENETCTYHDFNNKQWYAIRVQVLADRVQAWIDREQIVDLRATDRTLTIWFEEESVRPLAIATWRTTAALRNLRVRPLAQ
jgi:hypothetical protein